MLSSLFENVYVVIVLVVFFGATILIHEVGHFIVARLCGLIVQVFSIGFGPALWKKKVKGVLYKIGIFPLGGYVALPQLDPAGMDKIQGENNPEKDKEQDATKADEPELNTDIPDISPWKKIAVCLAGPIGNILLAIILAWVVFLVGMPLSRVSQDTTLGYVSDKSEAYEQGARIGDKIISVDGATVDTWGLYIQEVATSLKPVEIELESPGGEIKTVVLATETLKYGIKMVPGVESEAKCLVGKIAPDMSAERAGMIKGDVIKVFDGVKVLSPGHLTYLVADRKSKTVDVDIERKSESGIKSLTLSVTPDYDKTTKLIRIGIGFASEVDLVDTSVKVHPLPSAQLKQHAVAIFRLLKQLVTPGRSGTAAQMIGGPVAIISYYTTLIKASFMLAIWFTGFLNVNLAILNLLPIPVLDGGHIIFALWEVVTGRKPHPKLVNVLVNAFVILLLGLMLFLSVRDADRHTPLGRLIRGLFDPKDKAAKEEPAETLPIEDALPADK